MNKDRQDGQDNKGMVKERSTVSGTAVPRAGRAALSFGKWSLGTLIHGQAQTAAALNLKLET
jgi:dihydroxyacetone kinase